MTLSKLSICQYFCGNYFYPPPPQINQRTRQVSLPLGPGLVAMDVAWKVFRVQLLLSLATKENIAHFLSFLAAPGNVLPRSVSHSEAPPCLLPQQYEANLSGVWAGPQHKSHLAKEWVLSSGKANSSVSAGYQSKIIPEVSEETWVFSLAWLLGVFCLFVCLFFLVISNY